MVQVLKFRALTDDRVRRYICQLTDSNSLIRKARDYTVRYDIVYLRALKSWRKSQLNLAHDTENGGNKEENENINRIAVAQKKRFGW